MNHDPATVIEDLETKLAATEAKLSAAESALAASRAQVTKLQAEPYAQQLRANITRLLNMVGAVRTCTCGAKFWLVPHLTKRTPMPITAEAISHFADCPDKEMYRRRGSAGEAQKGVNGHE